MSSSGEATPEVSMDDGEVGDTAGSDCLDLEWRRSLFPDLTEPESDFSTSPLDRRVEFRGLSVLPEPGILERKVLKDLVESLVSDLLKEGSDWIPSGPAELLGLEVPLLSLDGWLPIVLRSLCERNPVAIVVV